MKYKLTLITCLFSTFAIAQQAPQPPANPGYQGTTGANNGRGAVNPAGANAGSAAPQPIVNKNATTPTTGSGHYDPKNCNTQGGKNVC